MSHVIDPMLAYLKAFYQRANHQDVKAAVLSHYDSTAVKDVLWTGCKWILRN